MSINLAKGQRISMTKAGGGTLTQVRMGLGWDAAPRKGFFGGLKSQDIDLDASCMVFSQDRQLLDSVWFRQLQSRDGAIIHTGDNLTGAGDGDDESIIVDLTRLSPAAHTLIFVVNSFTGQNFSQILNAVCRMVDSTNEQEIARYELSGSGTHNAQVMAKVNRDGAGWSMTAIGAVANGRTFQDLLPVVGHYL
ncbi:TerD family protein [Mycolicibacterium austroafricanum]|nr:TerD family protein [Mycolicibacterium austroafricanum]QRZ08155.1 tellurium resistance TerZ family protein [Mycolicibacterium austroafricanum]QZT69819.1 TerD family protein [Mycolicibacterium austroafricanum]